MKDNQWMLVAKYKDGYQVVKSNLNMFQAFAYQLKLNSAWIAVHQSQAEGLKVKHS